ncbi:MAG: alpha-L-fucosidase [Bacteroides sp.]|nr:alpha-L-fucosidase [Roseburia sp.]MCM1347024.1 alpha-L-fucosidase [Bacteroides sp.]MCM1420325.1 alpha-L-fucosidase [Bacteroides sp.]
MKKRHIIAMMLTALSANIICAQSYTDNFDGNMRWNTKKGDAALTEVQAFKGKALQLEKGTVVEVNIDLQPSSIYELRAMLRTESGADNVALQTEGLGKNNISISSAKPAWTEVKESFRTSEGQKSVCLQIIFDEHQNGSHAWADEIVITRTGAFKEQESQKEHDLPVRNVQTDMGVSMQPDEKIEWMRECRLGMFIHWGLYAGPAQGEWYMENKGISIDEYRKLAYPESGDMYFDASEFDARKWVGLAKDAGMKYMNMVTQHHDGYALFESHYMDAFTSKQTHNRDFVREYVEACREAGLKVGLYKTLINWMHPGYYDINGTDCKPNKFGYTTAEWHKEDARKMKEELYCQVRELMTNYGKIDQLFWDGGWLSQRGSDADAAPFWESGLYMDEGNEWKINPIFQTKDGAGNVLGLMGMVRQFQPDIVVNPRSGWIGDYTCEEGGSEVKGPIRKGVVEKCMSLTSGWGYSKDAEEPQKVRSLKDIKRICSDCMVRDMCFLVNIGPDRHGNVPHLIEERLRDFGKWTKENAQAIYGTRGGPWQPVDGQYGFTYKDNIIYVYLLGGYTDSTFTLPQVNKGVKARKAYLVEGRLPVKVSQRHQSITLSGFTPNKDDITIIAVELNKI